MILADEARRQRFFAHEAEGATAERQERRPPVGIGNAAEEPADPLAAGLVLVGHAGCVAGGAVEADPVGAGRRLRIEAADLGEDVAGPAGRLGLGTAQGLGDRREGHGDGIGRQAGEGLGLEGDRRRDHPVGPRVGQQRYGAEAARRPNALAGDAIDHRLVQDLLLHGAVGAEQAQRVALAVGRRRRNARLPVAEGPGRDLERRPLSIVAVAEDPIPVDAEDEMREGEVPVPRPEGPLAIGILVGRRAQRGPCLDQAHRVGRGQHLLRARLGVGPCRRADLQAIRAIERDRRGNRVARQHRFAGARDPPEVDEDIVLVVLDPRRVGIPVEHRLAGLPDVGDVGAGDRDADHLDRPLIGGNRHRQVDLGIAPGVDVARPGIGNADPWLVEIVDRLALQAGQQRGQAGREADLGAIG